MHYVCSQCGGVSPTEKNCDTEGCGMKDHPLTACACENPEHLGKLVQQGNEENTKEENSDNS